MRIYKTLFLITLFAGLIIMGIGIYLKIVNQYSDGYSTGRLGNIHYGMVNGFSGIFLGVLILLLSIWTYKIYRDEKDKFEKME